MRFLRRYTALTILVILIVACLAGYSARGSAQRLNQTAGGSRCAVDRGRLLDTARQLAAVADSEQEQSLRRRRYVGPMAHYDMGVRDRHD